MSIYTYLHKDHEDVKGLMNEIESLGSADESRMDIFNEVKLKLTVHTKAEEKIFYNPLKKIASLKEKIEHAKEEHEEADQLLEELTDESLAGAAWQQKFLKLKEAVEHHIREEEGSIFATAKTHVDKEQANQMEKDMKEEKKQLEQNLEIELREAEAS